MRSFNRRNFLLSGIGLSLVLSQPVSFARKKGRVEGIHPVSRQDWPPAIVPDHVSFLDNGLSCFSDQFGRLAIVDFKKGKPPHVVGELNISAQKIVDFVTSGRRAYALALENSPGEGEQHTLITIDLEKPNEPTIQSRVSLGQIAEAFCLAASGELVCVGGDTAHGEHLVAIFQARGKSSSPSFTSSFAVNQPIARLDIKDRNLVVLQPDKRSRIDYVNLAYPDNPQFRQALTLNGEYKTMARCRNALVVAGQSGGDYQAQSISLETQPHMVETQALGQITAVQSAAAQLDRCLILAETSEQRQIISLSLGKDLRLALDQTLALPGGKGSPASSLAVKERIASIASGWQGVDIISFDKSEWRHALNYAIPRFPASGVAAWDSLVLLAGNDLTLYDIAKPEKPTLTATAEPDSTVKAIAAAGPFILCQSKSKLSLRRMDKLDELIMSIDSAGQDMCFDRANHKAYVLSTQQKKTAVTPVSVYSNKLVPEKPLEFPSGLRKITAGDGILILSGLNDIATYRVSQDPSLLGKYAFDNLAIRDLSYANGHIYVAAVDRSSTGFLLIMSAEGNELARVGATDLPHDSIALAVADKQAVVIGRDKDGKDVASILDISAPAAPRVVSSFPSIAESSAVTIKDKLAIVVGRGLEILSLG